MALKGFVAIVIAVVGCIPSPSWSEETSVQPAGQKSAMGDAARLISEKYVAAERAIEAGKLENARDLLEQALDIGIDGTEPQHLSARREIFVALEIVALMIGGGETALDVNQRALDEAREIGDRAWEVTLLVKRARRINALGRRDKARAVLDLAGEVASEANDLCLEAEVSYGRAEGDLEAESFESAVRNAADAIRANRGCPPSMVELKALMVWAAACFRIGDEDCGRQLRDRMERYAERTKDPMMADLVQTFDAIDEIEEGTLAKGFETLMGWIRDVPDPAFDGMEQVVTGYGHLAENVESITDFAPPEIKAQQGAVPEGSRASVQIGSQLLRGRRAYKAGHWGEAARRFSRVAEIGIESDLLDVVVTARMQEGRALWRLGRRDDAVVTFTEAVRWLEQATRRFAVADFLGSYTSKHQQAYSLLIESLVATGLPELAFEYSERARARALLLQLGIGADAGRGKGSIMASMPSRNRQEIETLRAEIQAQQLDLSREATIDERPGLEAQQEKARAELDKLIMAGRLAASPASTTAVPSIDLATLQRQTLDEDATMIAFYFVPQRLIVWVIDHDRVSAKVFDWKQEDEHQVSCLTTQLARSRARGARPISGCPDIETASVAVWRKLIVPLSPLIRDRRVVLVPHGALHHLPFAALRDPDSGRYWIEDVELSYTPSASALHHLGPVQRIGSEALILGSPETGSAPLPWARKEAETVAQRLGQHARVGPAAVEDLVWNHADTIDILHLAAHGYFEAEQPRSSRVQLGLSESHDGRLEIRELIEFLRFPVVDLVVLSACGTAIGDRTRGDDVVSLVRAFMAADAPSVIATLWPIDDRASADLMDAFYSYLKVGRPLGSALREAQLAMLRKPETAEPYYWAAFGLYGIATSHWQE